MAEDTLVVRKVNKAVFRKFKQKAVEENMSLGKAVTDAMLEWLDKNAQRKRPNFKNFLKSEGIIKTKGKVRWSEQIDETLYG